MRTASQVFEAICAGQSFSTEYAQNGRSKSRQSAQALGSWLCRRHVLKQTGTGSNSATPLPGALDCAILADPSAAVAKVVFDFCRITLSGMESVTANCMILQRL